ncbi:DUF885 family protein [Fulvivirgaceae bacterium PWU4]|uniref:DUF885 family protein n=1 Tax=Chryseosolibacter histidini TaxID=2782349 RepID=A0AAP2DMC2_9BACT|nr:DUF885 domain-containing protein [Chryseosolibacter histidini]MBT1696659.1 DUF885 family protein [Chryseosolibacter histidini]
MSFLQKNVLTIAALSVIIFSCSTDQKKETDTAGIKRTFDSLLNAYHEERLPLSPLEATVAGDNRYNALFPNVISAAYINQFKEFNERYRKNLSAIDRSKLSAEDQLSYDVLAWECDIALEGSRWKEELMPINQIFSMNLYIAQFTSGQSIQPFKTVKDYEDWLKRLDGYVAWCDTAIVNMKKGMATGYVLPKALAKKVVPQLASFDHGPVKDHLFFMPAKNMPADFSAADKTRLSKAYEDAVATKVIPVHRRLKDFFVKEYIPACRESSGVDAIPYGKQYYAYRIKLFTTTDLSADEIFALGKREVDRITQEMEKVKDQVGFKGDMKAFFDHLRTKKELMPFTRPEQVIENFNAIHEKMKPNLAKLFDKTPKTGFEVRRTEAFREASASAEYNPGSQDGSRPGIFYVPIPDVKHYNVLSDEDLFLHEAIPGHHYQIMLQMEDTSLPQFRRILTYSAYAEGWALYTESLGKELGLYTDPYQYMGMLSAEMHRAIRLVVDAGMHTQGWTREQAIQYSKDHEAETEEGIIAEIERYMAGPGQALSYKIGQLKIRELRTKAEQALGPKFNIAQFHNQVLETGSVPMKLLEEKINRWIEANK